MKSILLKFYFKLYLNIFLFHVYMYFKDLHCQKALSNIILFLISIFFWKFRFLKSQMTTLWYVYNMFYLQVDNFRNVVIEGLIIKVIAKFIISILMFSFFSKSGREKRCPGKSCIYGVIILDVWTPTTNQFWYSTLRFVFHWIFLKYDLYTFRVI